MARFKPVERNVAAPLTWFEGGVRLIDVGAVPSDDSGRGIGRLGVRMSRRRRAQSSGRDRYRSWPRPTPMVADTAGGRVVLHVLIQLKIRANLDAPGVST